MEQVDTGEEMGVDQNRWVRPQSGVENGEAPRRADGHLKPIPPPGPRSASARQRPKSAKYR